VTPPVGVEDVADFRYDPAGFEPQEVFFVIKSQDQPERRRRLLESLKRDRVGRFDERPVSEGLIVGTELRPGRRIDRASSFLVRSFREPRGLVLLDDGTMLVSEIDRIIHLHSDGRELRDYRHPLFAFIHSIDLSADGQRLLVDSPGYDALLEIELASGAVLWEWVAWEHGFNPSHDGIYFARKRELYEEYLASGLRAVFVEPEKSTAHGLMTSARTDHPSSAIYHPRDPGKVLVTLGHSGRVGEIDRAAGTCSAVVEGLALMPHGIQAHGGGWIVTDTMRGECWFLNETFQLQRKLAFGRLPGKPPELAGNEWLQVVRPLTQDTFIGLDANRGLVLVDPSRRSYAVVPIDEDWCVHWCVPAMAGEKRHAVFALQEADVRHEASGAAVRGRRR
jgi:hypothetical protein